MTDDPRIEILAQAAGERIGGVDAGYYKLAAKEFLAFADALEGHYRTTYAAEPAGGPLPAYSHDVRDEHSRTADIIKRRIAQALQQADKRLQVKDDMRAGIAASIAIELQSLLDELA
jgi:hypothetical protein